MSGLEKTEGGGEEREGKGKQGKRSNVCDCVCGSETLYLCLLSGREGVLFFLALTYQSGPTGREQSSVGRRGVS